MAKVIEGESREFSDPNDITTQVKEYVQVKSSMEMLEARQKSLRSSIFEHIESNGEFDDKGNVFLELPYEIDGVARLEKQKRVTRKIDELTAEEILKENNLEDEVYETVRVVSEDKLMAAFYEGKITEDELERIYPAKVVWALTTKKK
jgi:hypothetical protein